jgi:hypothetical protein
MGSGRRLLVLLSAGACLGACNDEVTLGSWGTNAEPVPAEPPVTEPTAMPPTTEPTSMPPMMEPTAMPPVLPPPVMQPPVMEPDNTWKVEDPGDDQGRLCGTEGEPEALNPDGESVGVSITYTYWSWPSQLDSIDTDFTIESEFTKDGYLWTHQFDFVGGGGGFVGLQARGGYQAEPPLGEVETTDMFVFWMPATSLDAALGDVPYPDARAAVVVQGGSQWRTIHVKYDWEPCRTYRLRVARESTTTAGNIWYGAWISDGSERTYLGRMLVPGAWGKIDLRSSTWSNRFGYGTFRRCSDPEPASIFFGTPIGNDGAVQPIGFANTFDPVACPTSRFTTFSNGVRQQIGFVAD